MILDIFRASNTIIELLHRGAEEVVVAENLDRARELKSGNPDWVVLGERGGKMIEGFDGDNSPAGVSEAISGKTVALTTSGGARCIAACPPDRTVMIASFANAHAAWSATENVKSGEVSYWAVGENAERTADEDIACARFLDRSPKPDNDAFPQIREDLINCSGAARLTRLGQHADLEFCLSLNTRTIVPVRVETRDDLSVFRANDAM